VSLFREQIQSLGACLGDGRARFFLSGHFIPAAFFNEFGSFPAPATQFLEFFQFCFVIRLLHKLGDADCGPACQDRLVAHGLGRAHRSPTTPHKADDYYDDCSKNKAPNAVLNFCGGDWLHCPFSPFARRVKKSGYVVSNFRIPGSVAPPYWFWAWVIGLALQGDAGLAVVEHAAELVEGQLFFFGYALGAVAAFGNPFLKGLPVEE